MAYEKKQNAIMTQEQAQQSLADLRSMLDKNLGNIRQVASKHLTPERMVKIVIGAASRTPELLKCTPASIVKAVLQAAELGLEPASSLGEFWLVPFFNSKTGRKEAQGIPGYRGLITLARRTGEISNLYAESVYECDTFNVELGLEPKLEHKPNYENESRESAANLRFVYAVARFKDGSFQFAVLSRKQIDALRGRSKASTNGPWVTDYEEMAKKTAIRRLSKYLPMSVELVKANTLQAKAEAGTFDEPQVIFDADDLAIEGDVPPQTSELPPQQEKPALDGGGSSLADALKSATGRQRAEQPAAQPEAHHAAGSEDDQFFN